MILVQEPELLVLLAAVIASLILWFDARRRRAQPSLATVGAIDLFCGLLTFGLMALHLGAVVGRALMGKGFAGAPIFTYDFRFNALILMAIVIMGPSFLCLRYARCLIRGDAAAWKVAVWSSVILVALNGPLMPIQGFAIGLVGLALSNLVVLSITRRSFRQAKQ